MKLTIEERRRRLRIALSTQIVARFGADRQAYEKVLQARGFEAVGQHELGTLYACAKEPELGHLLVQLKPGPGQPPYRWPQLRFVELVDA